MLQLVLSLLPVYQKETSRLKSPCSQELQVSGYQIPSTGLSFVGLAVQVAKGQQLEVDGD